MNPRLHQDPSPTPSPGLTPRHRRDGPLRSLPGEGLRNGAASVPSPCKGEGQGGGQRRCRRVLPRN